MLRAMRPDAGGALERVFREERVALLATLARVELGGAGSGHRRLAAVEEEQVVQVDPTRTLPAAGQLGAVLVRRRSHSVP